MHKIRNEPRPPYLTRLGKPMRALTENSSNRYPLFKPFDDCLNNRIIVALQSSLPPNDVVCPCSIPRDILVPDS